MERCNREAHVSDALLWASDCGRERAPFPPSPPQPRRQPRVPRPALTSRPGVAAAATSFLVRHGPAAPAQERSLLVRVFGSRAGYEPVDSGSTALTLPPQPGLLLALLPAPPRRAKAPRGRLEKTPPPAPSPRVTAQPRPRPVLPVSSARGSSVGRRRVRGEPASPQLAGPAGWTQERARSGFEPRNSCSLEGPAGQGLDAFSKHCTLSPPCKDVCAVQIYVLSSVPRSRPRQALERPEARPQLQDLCRAEPPAQPPGFPLQAVRRTPKATRDPERHFRHNIGSVALPFHR